MQQNPFNSNPLTRNRVLPTVQFARTDAEKKNLQVPKSVYSYEDAMKAYNSMHVPQQETPFDRIGAFNVKIAADGTRIIQSQSSIGEWGDAWGRDEFRREQTIDRRSAEFAKQSAAGNAKLSADLENDDFRKQLLADIDSGKYFPNTRLEEVDESITTTKCSNIRQQAPTKEKENGSNSKQ